MLCYTWLYYEYKYALINLITINLTEVFVSKTITQMSNPSNVDSPKRLFT